MAFRRSTLFLWTTSAAVLIGAVQTTTEFSLIPWLLFGLVAVLFNARPIRRRLLSAPLLKWFRSVVPPISATESAAIDAGTVWWDRELFSGNPNWKQLLEYPAATLSDEEAAFLEGPVNELCAQLDDWRINSEIDDLPPEVWDFLSEHRFFGMIIPKAYGGLEFSPRAQSEVLMRIASRSAAAAFTVMVPNALGPGELLMHYGTTAQKEHFLPRLAVGTDIPAFALTSPWAGSDAASMTDVGIVEYGDFEGKSVLGLRLNWSKRYITLAPKCTVLGLAFKARDPDGLLGDVTELGITCALIPTDTIGVRVGDRHDPGVAFQNGPTTGNDVFVPLDWIIGGPDYLGEGWRMLMDCLSVGRSISLPALGAATGQLCCRATGAYARIRKQFNTPIGKFEGVDEALARIAGNTYRMNAARIVTASALKEGEKPAIISAILKYHNTEGMRAVIMDAMDIHGGRAVCHGPSNYLQSLYRAVPVAITVEGANILTRSLIIFGQGLIRCHPFLLKEMHAAANSDPAIGLKEFDRAFFPHVGLTISNGIRSFVMGLTGGLFSHAPAVEIPARYFHQLTRLSAAFAFAADIVSLALGGDIKRREKLSARFADALSHLYLASAVIKHHLDQGAVAEEWPVARWALEDSLAKIEVQLQALADNMPGVFIGRFLKFALFPFGIRNKQPSDRLGTDVANLLLTPSATRDRLTSCVYRSNDASEPIGLLDAALDAVLTSEPLEAALRKGVGQRVAPHNVEDVLRAGRASNVINELDATAIRKSMSLTARVIAVDQFDVKPESAAIDSPQEEIGQVGA